MAGEEISWSSSSGPLRIVLFAVIDRKSSSSRVRKVNRVNKISRSSGF
jgi:hypothetical protein